MWGDGGWGDKLGREGGGGTVPAQCWNFKNTKEAAFEKKTNGGL